MAEHSPTPDHASRPLSSAAACSPSLGPSTPPCATNNGAPPTAGVTMQSAAQGMRRPPLASACAQPQPRGGAARPAAPTAPAPQQDHHLPPQPAALPDLLFPIGTRFQVIQTKPYLSHMLTSSSTPQATPSRQMPDDLHLLQVVTLYGFRGDGLVTERRVSMKHGELAVLA